MTRRTTILLAVVGVAAMAGVGSATMLGDRISQVPSGEGLENFIAEAAETCPARSAQYVEHTACLGGIILNLIEERGAKDAVTAVHSYLASDPSAISACHSATHVSGRQMREPDAIRDLISADDGSCNFGLTHGALEGFAQHVDEEVFLRLAPMMCTNARAGILRYNCAHGIGHAFALRYGGTLPELLGRCSTLDVEDHEGCVTAMSMAYTNDNASLAEDVRIEVPRVEDSALGTVCAGLGGVVEATCWQMVPNWYSDIPIDQLAVLTRDACMRAEEYGAKCANGLGQALFFRSDPPPDVDADSIERAAIGALPWCTGALRVECVAGIIGGAAAWWAETHDDFSEYPPLCALLEGEDAAACRSVEAFWRDQLNSLSRGG